MRRPSVEQRLWPTFLPLLLSLRHEPRPMALRPCSAAKCGCEPYSACTSRQRPGKGEGDRSMTVTISDKKVAVLGAGKIGSILLQALLKKGLLDAHSTCATVQHAERADALAK